MLISLADRVPRNRFMKFSVERVKHVIPETKGPVAHCAWYTRILLLLAGPGMSLCLPCSTRCSLREIETFLVLIIGRKTHRHARPNLPATDDACNRL